MMRAAELRATVMEDKGMYDLKRDALERLRVRYDEQRLQVVGVDRRLGAYYDFLTNPPVRGVTDADERDVHPWANIYELLGALKLLRLMRMYELNAERVRQVLRIFEGEWDDAGQDGAPRHLRGGIKQPGRDGAEVYRFEPFQVFVMTAIYGIDC